MNQFIINQKYLCLRIEKHEIVYINSNPRQRCYKIQIVYTFTIISVHFNGSGQL